MAAAAGAEELQLHVYDPSFRVLSAVLKNRNVTEREILIIAGRKNVPADILEVISKDKQWSRYYPIRLALARNPRSPLSVSLSVVRFLRILDLEEISRSPSVPLVFRRKVEAMLIERIPTLPLGYKKTFAKQAAGRVLLKLLQERIAAVVSLCLDNPHMAETHLYKVLNRADTAQEAVLLIANHPSWSTRPLIRFALARNSRTPLSLSVRFLQTMKLVSLRELYGDPSLPVTTKPFVHRELRRRGIDPEKIDEERVYEIPEEENGDWDSDEIIDEGEREADNDRKDQE